MIVNNTPVEHHPDLGLWVKREDLCCPPPGPPFSKTRGVFRHIERRPEKYIGVLDTYHSQAGHAVATACAELGKTCINYYPVYKKDRGLQPQQKAAGDLGAYLNPLGATASWALYYQARDHLKAYHATDSYLMPNALKLPETVTETAAEFERTDIPDVNNILVATSSGTIASGVILGAIRTGWAGKIVLHMGYARAESEMMRYMMDKVGRPLPPDLELVTVNEGYKYADKAKGIDLPPFPCNPYYDLKLFKWWINHGRDEYGSALLWNIG